MNFTNTLIILTSNLGSHVLSEMAEGKEKKDVVFDKVMEVVRGHFRPEFLNRLDEIILFNRLSRKNMENIVVVQFARLAKRLISRNVKLDLDKTAQNYLAEKGYDALYGARPLKRLIQREIENILAEKILRGKILDGQKVDVVANGGVLGFVVS